MGIPDSEILPGSSYLVTQDIMIDGMLAFKEGEKVVVDSINPNPDTPSYLYVVFSKRMQKSYSLCSDNLTHEMPEQNTARYKRYCRDCGREASGQSEYCGQCGGLIIEPPAKQGNTSGTPPAPAAHATAARSAKSSRT